MPIRISGLIERPDDAERRALVARLQIAPEEVPEELAVAVEVGVDRHGLHLVNRKLRWSTGSSGAPGIQRAGIQQKLAHELERHGGEQLVAVQDPAEVLRVVAVRVRRAG